MPEQNLAYIPHPFGMVMPGRSFNGAEYRYGFNGKENDDEVKGTSNQQDYGLRIYDGRIGKFLSVDPLFKSYPWNSTYSFAEGDVIRAVDLDGGEKFMVIRCYENSQLKSTTLVKVPYNRQHPDYKNKGVLYIEIDSDPASLRNITNFFASFKHYKASTEELGKMAEDAGLNRIDYSKIIKKSKKGSEAFSMGVLEGTFRPYEMQIYKRKEDFSVGTSAMTRELAAQSFDIYFANDNSDLTVRDPDNPNNNVLVNEEHLDKVNDLVSAFPVLSVDLEGHTDNNASEEHNNKLAEERIENVASKIEVLSSINKKEIVKGEAEATETTKENRWKDRKVTIKINYPEKCH